MLTSALVPTANARASRPWSPVKAASFVLATCGSFWTLVAAIALD